MRPGLLPLLAAIGVAASVACSGEVAVLAQLEGVDGGDATPLKQLEVRALPYDRDAIFDELRARAAQPEPAVPDSLLQLQTDIQTAQDQWNAATNRWNTARDSLRKLSDALEAMRRRGERGSAQYRLLFNDFGDQEGRESSAKRQMDGDFARFDNLQRRYTEQAQRYSLLHEQWAEDAYSAVDSVIAVRLEQLGREAVADTTDDNGIVRISLKKGQWWIHARYALVYEELYWNEPVEVTGGDPVQVLLNRETAERRRIWR